MDKRENAFSGENLGWRLETIVYLELLRRKAGTENDIYYYQGRSAEADFVVCDANKRRTCDCNGEQEIVATSLRGTQ
mgnify:CR=1 FL=1